MNTRPIFRERDPSRRDRQQRDPSRHRLAGAIAVGVPFGIAYAWSNNRPLRALAWSASTFAASLPAFFWAIALELLMIVIYFQFGAAVPADRRLRDRRTPHPARARARAAAGRIHLPADGDGGGADPPHGLRAHRDRKGSTRPHAARAPRPAERRPEHHRGDAARCAWCALQPRDRRVRVHLGRRRVWRSCRLWAAASSRSRAGSPWPSRWAAPCSCLPASSRARV